MKCTSSLSQSYSLGHTGLGLDISSVESSNGWSQCVRNSLSVLELVRSLTPQQLIMTSPSVAITLWIPTIVLVLHLRHIKNKDGSVQVASGLETFKSALGKLAMVWNVAQRVLGT